MDDAFSPWLRLSLCPDTPSALLRELTSSPPDYVPALTQALSRWLDEPNRPPTFPRPLPDALAAGPDTWRRLHDQLHDPNVESLITRALHWLKLSHGHHLLTPEHLSWPTQLHALPDPPALLYAVGDPSVLSLDQVAMVGARRCTPDGRRFSGTLAQSLSERGWAVTSGLALGIDTEAHRGCLSAGSPTIAVMATSATDCYPAANRPLARGILRHGGCLITETPLDSPLRRYYFPRRNRLISALSRGVVVIEAGLKSGTLTTARHAAAQGREVMVVPGSIHDPVVSGCHQLIREGATLITGIDDVVECLGNCRNG